MARSELPKGWEWKRLGDLLVEIKSGFACSKKHMVDSGITHLRTNNIGVNGELDLSQLVYLPPELVNSNIYNLRAGDILFNNTNSVELVGKSAIVRGDFPYAFSNHITRLRTRNDIVDPPWLTLSLRSYWLKGVFAKGCRRWIGQAGFNPTMLVEIEIPLPPLEEQRRIVARIEELLSRIEQAKSLRQKSLAETSAIMPSTLHGIFSKAEEDVWEKQPIEELVKDIRTGTTPPSKEEKYYGGDIQWFTPGDLGEDKFLVKSARTITHTAIEEGKAKIFEKGTILFVGIGATLGKVGIAGKDASSNQQITGMLFKDAVVPDFAYYWFRYKHDYIRVLSPAATLPIINQDGLGSLVMEYPSVDEQRRIVAYFDSLQEKVNELQRFQSETKKEMEQITQSILTSAFRGEL